MFSGLAFGNERAVPVRRWTALASFTLQAALVAAAVTYPLLHPESLPSVLHPVFVPVSNSVSTVESHQRVSHGSGAVMMHPIVVNQRSLVFAHGSHQSEAAENPAAAPGFAVIGTGDANGVLSAISGDYIRPMPAIATQQRTVRVSVMMEGNLIHKVEPQYPAIAKQLGIQGSVIVKAWISREGSIERAVVESGQPLLSKAALDAVRQWRYRPYYLNHEPVEVETEITVNFVLQR